MWVGRERVKRSLGDYIGCVVLEIENTMFISEETLFLFSLLPDHLSLLFFKSEYARRRRIHHSLFHRGILPHPVLIPFDLMLSLVEPLQHLQLLLRLPCPPSLPAFSSPYLNSLAGPLVSAP